MRGLFSRLTGKGPDEPLPPFTLVLPDGWAGGHGPLAYLEALVRYARAHPECHDSAFALIDHSRGAEDLYMAAAACGPDAAMSVNAEDIPPELSAEDALEAYVTTNIEGLASGDDLIGEPTTTRTDDPIAGGWVLRWTWSFEGNPPSSFALHAFASGGRLWLLTFSSSAETEEEHEPTFLTIASSFRVTQSAPSP